MIRLEARAVTLGVVLTVAWALSWAVHRLCPPLGVAAVAALTIAAVCNWATDAGQPDPIETRLRASEATYKEKPT